MKIRFSLDVEGQPLSELTRLVKAVTVLLLILLVGYVTYTAELLALVYRHVNEQVERIPHRLDPPPSSAPDHVAAQEHAR